MSAAADSSGAQVKASPAIPSNKWIIAMVVSLATFMEVLDTTITNVSLRHIAGSLGAGQDESTWVLTSYLVANGIILPLSGWLSDVMGRKRFFITCILGFTAASFFCGTSTSLFELVIFRILQGAAGGGLQPTQQAIILDSFPPEKRGTVFAITGITMIVAPILGPTLGGLLTDNYSWRWVFYINVPVGLFAAFMVGRLLQDPPHAKAQGARKIDFFGLGLVTLGLASLQIVLDKGQQEDWFTSPLIIIYALAAFVCLCVAVIWLWERKEPIIDLALFRDKGFALSCVLIFLTGFVLYGGSALMPLMLQTQFGYNATLAGMVLSPGGIAVVFLMPLAGKLIARVQVRRLIFIGLCLCATGMFYTMHYTPQTDFNTFVFMRVAQVLGLPFLFIPISTLAFANVPKEKSNKASALFALFRNIGGSIGIAVVATYQIMQQQVRQHMLSQHLVPGAYPYEHYAAQVKNALGAGADPSFMVYRTLQTQSAMVAYSDTYEMLGLLMVLAAIIALFLLPPNKPLTKTPVAAH